MKSEIEKLSKQISDILDKIDDAKLNTASVQGHAAVIVSKTDENDDNYDNLRMALDALISTCDTLEDIKTTLSDTVEELDSIASYVV